VHLVGLAPQLELGPGEARGVRVDLDLVGVVRLDVDRSRSTKSVPPGSAGTVSSSPAALAGRAPTLPNARASASASPRARPRPPWVAVMLLTPRA
jgi:hypothetical protein